MGRANSFYKGISRKYKHWYYKQGQGDWFDHAWIPLTSEAVALQYSPVKKQVLQLSLTFKLLGEYLGVLKCNCIMLSLSYSQLSWASQKHFRI